MRFRASMIVVLVLAAGCGGGGPKETPLPAIPVLDRQDLLGAVMNQKDVGDDWESREDSGPNTVQIGGRVGAANVRPLLAEGTSAFDQKEGTGFISSTIMLLRSTDVARAVIPAHEEAAGTTNWTQEREDGGTAAFSFSGAVQGLPSLGDAMFAARLKAVITSAEDQTSENAVEYVVFSVGPLLGFVVTQDVGAATYARRLEARVAKLLTK